MGQHTDSPHVLAAIRVFNRLERVGETLRHALNSLAVVAPDWLQAQVPREWFDRHDTRLENCHFPKTAAARGAVAVTIGADGRQLPPAVDAATDHPWLSEVPAMPSVISRPACTQAKEAPRQLTVWPQVFHEAIQAGRQRQESAEFTAQYAQRAGIEGAHAQGSRRCGLHHRRYLGLAKTRLQQVITAVALNVVRLGVWWLGAPLAKTHCSPFAALQASIASGDLSQACGASFTALRPAELSRTTLHIPTGNPGFIPRS